MAFPPDERRSVQLGTIPEGSDAAIAHCCEALRAKGADYLLFPATSLWWLEHYSGFTSHLDTCFRRVVDMPDTCVIYALRAEAALAPLPNEAFRAKLSVVGRPPSGCYRAIASPCGCVSRTWARCRGRHQAMRTASIGSLSAAVGRTSPGNRAVRARTHLRSPTTWSSARRSRWRW